MILPELVTADPENATHRVRRGDVAFTWFAAGSAYGVDADFSEICWFYDDDACPSMHGGPVPVSLFGRFVGDWSEFARESRRLKRVGVRGLVVERLESPTERRDSVVFRPRHGAAFDPALIRLGGSRLLAVFHHSPESPVHGPRTMVLASLSEDGGVHWGAAFPIVAGEVPGLRLEEAVVSEDYPALRLVGDSAGGGWWRMADEGRGWLKVDRVPGGFQSSLAPGLSSDFGGVEIAPGICRPVHETASGAVGCRLDDGRFVALMAIWDNSPDADVPGVCGIHASVVDDSGVIDAD